MPFSGTTSSTEPRPVMRVTETKPPVPICGSMNVHMSAKRFSECVPPTLPMVTKGRPTPKAPTSIGFVSWFLRVSEMLKPEGALRMRRSRPRLGVPLVDRRLIVAAAYSPAAAGSAVAGAPLVWTSTKTPPA